MSRWFVWGDFPLPCNAHAMSSCCITVLLCVVPQMIKSLKKAMAPVLSDVSVEWVFPESTEVLVSPVRTSCLFPGDRLVGYGIICNTSPYISNPRSVSPRRGGWWGRPGSRGCWCPHAQTGISALCACSGGVYCFLTLFSREMVGETLGRNRNWVDKGAGAQAVAPLGWEPADGRDGGTYSLSLLSPRTRGDVTA